MKNNIEKKFHQVRDNEGKKGGIKVLPEKKKMCVFIKYAAISATCGPNERPPTIFPVKDLCMRRHTL